MSALPRSDCYSSAIFSKRDRCSPSHPLPNSTANGRKVALSIRDPVPSHAAECLGKEGSDAWFFCAGCRVLHSGKVLKAKDEAETGTESRTRSYPFDDTGSFARMLDSPVISIGVGSDGAQYKVHQDILTFHSKLCCRILAESPTSINPNNPILLESQAASITAFEIAVRWMYSGFYSVPNRLRQQIYVVQAKVYALAKFLEMEGLMRCVVEAMQTDRGKYSFREEAEVEDFVSAVCYLHQCEGEDRLIIKRMEESGTSDPDSEDDSEVDVVLTPSQSDASEDEFGQNTRTERIYVSKNEKLEPQSFSEKDPMMLLLVEMGTKGLKDLSQSPHFARLVTFPEFLADLIREMQL